MAWTVQSWDRSQKRLRYIRPSKKDHSSSSTHQKLVRKYWVQCILKSTTRIFWRDSWFWSTKNNQWSASLRIQKTGLRKEVTSNFSYSWNFSCRINLHTRVKTNIFVKLFAARSPNNFYKPCIYEPNKCTRNLEVNYGGINIHKEL